MTYRDDKQDARKSAPDAGVPEVYDPVAKTLHWGMALAMGAMVCLGLYMQAQPVSMATFHLFDFHKALGLTLLVLAVLRLAWRRFHGAPPMLTEGTKPWELALAKLVHVLLYGLMIAIPIIGWLGASASGLPMTYFGLAPIPAIVGASESFQDLAFSLHRYAVWLLILAVGLHVAGALKRHLKVGDETLYRMLPFGMALSGRRNAVAEKKS